MGAKGAPLFRRSSLGHKSNLSAADRKAATKKSAEAFLDWALGPEVMKAYAKVYPVTAYPTGEPIPEGYPADPFKQLIKSDLGWAAKNREAILAEWSRRYDSKTEVKK
jgi:iron(III) transport system substrate-binding protein